LDYLWNVNKQVLDLVTCEKFLIIILQIEFFVVQLLQQIKWYLTIALYFFLLLRTSRNRNTNCYWNLIDKELYWCIVHRLTSLLTYHIHGFWNLILVNVITFSLLRFSEYLPQVLASSIRIGLNCLENWRKTSEGAYSVHSSLIFNIFFKIWLDISKTGKMCLLMTLVKLL